MIVQRKSVVSGKEHQMDLPITAEQIVAYQKGTLVQHAFPNLTPAEREFFLTGVTAEEWQATFGEEE